MFMLLDCSHFLQEKEIARYLRRGPDGQATTPVDGVDRSGRRLPGRIEILATDTST